MIIRKTYSEMDIKGIKTLLSENHFSVISEKERYSEGFIIINYSLDDLKALHEIAASVVAIYQNQVIGYALAATKDSIGINPLLDDLIQFIEKTTYQSKPLRKTKYIVVGQLCVSKDYRRQKIAQKIYERFKNTYGKEFDYCITSVDLKNLGSLKAHLLRGFKEIQTTRYKNNTYSVILWDWTESTNAEA